MMGGMVTGGRRSGRTIRALLESMRYASANRDAQVYFVSRCPGEHRRMCMALWPDNGIHFVKIPTDLEGAPWRGHPGAAVFFDHLVLGIS